MKLLFLCFLCVSVSARQDDTLKDGASGKFVVEAVIRLITEKCVFSHDMLFLRRLAYVESKDGTDPATFRIGYYGGIWQVDLDMFLQTKRITVKDKNVILARYGINWYKTNWNDLLKPFYSGLAAKIFFHQTLLKSKFPAALNDQASFWVKNYNKGGTESDFVTTSQQISKICDVVADIAFMLDGSISVGKSNFQKIKNFVNKVVLDLNVGSDALKNSRVSASVFSDTVSVFFNFNSFSNVSDYSKAIGSISYSNGTTNTQLALRYLTSRIFLPSKGARGSGVPKIAVVVTDGFSNNKISTLAAAKALLESGVTVFAVGVGNNLDIQELIAMASEPNCKHLFVLSNFNEFDAFVNQIEQSVCEVKTTLVPGTNTKTFVHKYGTKYYFYSLNKTCELLKISSNKGAARVYYSSSYQPNPARFEGTSTVTPSNPNLIYSDKKNETIFITVEALTDASITFSFEDFDCKCLPGYKSVSVAKIWYRCARVTNGGSKYLGSLRGLILVVVATLALL